MLQQLNNIYISCSSPVSPSSSQGPVVRQRHSGAEILDLDSEMATASIGLDETELDVEDVVQGNGQKESMAVKRGSTIEPSSTKQNDTRHIRFGPVHVASYYMTLGSNPGGTSGPPIELGDFHRSYHFDSVESHFETSHPSRHPDEYKLANRMPRALRDELVARDHSEDEICHEIKAAFDIRLSRLRSSKEDILKAWTEEEESRQKEQETRDAQLLAGLHQGAGKRRTRKRQQKSVSWLSPAFLGQSPSKTSAGNSVASSSEERDSTVKADTPTIQEENEIACASSDDNVVGKRTGPRRIKSKSCPSTLFSENHVKEHATQGQTTREPVDPKQASETLVADKRKGGNGRRKSSSRSNGKVKKSILARLFSWEERT